MRIIDEFEKALFKADSAQAIVDSLREEIREKISDDFDEKYLGDPQTGFPLSECCFCRVFVSTGLFGCNVRFTVWFRMNPFTAEEEDEKEAAFYRIIRDKNEHSLPGKEYKNISYEIELAQALSGEYKFDCFTL